ncbi:hypothetical protein AMTR_s00062p00191160 [Amborella trichopoda]|uniref:Myb/SANT-like domain-containing protein n=1 Tax=Amborella trichopoda TaxID=13333 RepID=U5DB00_AMBTC|nr:hypothetical protein AMTR_s00062p00191160 [Amborella trichopoda]
MDPYTSSSAANENMGGKRSTQWTQSEDDYLIELMEKEIRATGRGGGGGIDAMTVKYGSRNNVTRLKSKHKFFRNIYNDIKKLKDVSGFGWGESRRIVTAEVAVWNGVLAVYSSGSKRRRSHTPIGVQQRSKQSTHIESMSLAMTKMAHSIEMLACDTIGNNSTPMVDGPSKARRDAYKIVEGMWKAGEVGDTVLLMAARIFQDSTKRRCY